MKSAFRWKLWGSNGKPKKFSLVVFSVANPSNFCDSLQQQTTIICEYPWLSDNKSLTTNQASATGERAWLPPSFSGMSHKSSSEWWVRGKLCFKQFHISVLYFEEHELWSFQQNPLTVPAEALFGTIWPYWPVMAQSDNIMSRNYSPAIEHGNQDWKHIHLILYIYIIHIHIWTNELWICPWVNMCI